MYFLSSYFLILRKSFQIYLVAGGYNNAQEKTVIESTELFKDGVWILIPKSLPTPLQSGPIAKIDDKILLFGKEEGK